VDELERFCRIDDRVMKYLTVMLEEDTTPERVREEIARKAEAKNKPPVVETDLEASEIEPAALESEEAEEPEEDVAETTEQPLEEEE
jgi:small subunit ribosomal protein S6